MATISGGIKVSLKTPQARDDLYGYNEEALTSGTIYLSVMANDLGGAAKSLYSTGGLTSALGASIYIVGDGTIAYDASSIAPEINQLKQDEHATDSFTYSIQLGNGTLSWATVTIDIVGTNDVPVIRSAAQSGLLTEDGNLVATGQVQATDVDHDSHLTYSGNASGTYGSFTVDATTGVWQYTLNNNAPVVQALIDGDSRTEQFTVTVTDEYNATATQTVDITVHGHTDGNVPAAQNVTAGGDEDTTIVVTLAGLNIDGSASYIITSLPANGNLYSDGELDMPAEIGSSYASKNFYFVPDENFNGSVSFQYTIADSQGEADATPATVTINVAPLADPLSTSGTAVDGYIVSATVFADANHNGSLDSGEAHTTTGANGQFTLVGDSGPLVLMGGTDMSTGLAFEGVLKAPAGSGVVTPLTTLIAALIEGGAAPAAAQDAIKTTLGLVLANDLTSFDPVHQALAGNADALAVYAAGIQIQNIIVLAAAATGMSVSDAAAATFGALSAAITAAAPVDLVAPSTELLGAIAGDAVDPAALNAVIVAVNTAVGDAVNAGDGLSALKEMAQVAVVVQSEDSANAAGGTGTATFITNLDAAVAVAAVGVIGETVTGNAGDNALTGGTGNDAIDGLAGRDTIHGGAGNDYLFGNSGSDLLFGDDGDDQLFGGSASDTLVGGFGNDLLDGGENPANQLADTDAVSYAINDAIVGATGVNVNLSTGIATDGLGGSDTLLNIEKVIGTKYDDVLTGGDQTNFGTNRSEQFEGRGGNDTITGGIDNNLATYENAAAGIHVDLADGKAWDDGDGGVDTLVNINRIRGSAHDDLIYGSTTATGSERFEGMAGADTIDGRAGIDYIMYGNSLGAVSVAFNADGSGTASDGYGTTDSFFNIEGVRGSAFNDTLTGSDRTDVTERFEGMAGNDIITGGLGQDQVEFGQSPTRAILNLSASSITVDGVTVDSNTAIDGFGSIDTLSGVERAVGSRFDDYMVGGIEANRFDGGVGNDTLLGGGGNDTLVGSAGDDALDGGAGTGDRADYTTSTSAVTVNLGIDTVSTTGLGGTANDGFGGNDTLTAIEQVTGSAFNDTLTGDGNSNRLDGGAGNDTLNGGSGNDTLIGGAGNDILVGGLGNDTFTWSAGDQGASVLPAVDTVAGFNNTLNGDKLNLADLLVGEHQNAVSLDAYLDFSLSGSDTIISVKSSGTIVDQKIVLQNVNLFSLGANDQAIISAMITNGKLITDA